MTVRIMTINDYEQVYSLWLNTPNMGLHNIDDSQNGIAKFLERNPRSCFVAENDSHVIVGAILCGHDGRRGNIYHAAVATGEQRHGIGSALVNAAVSALEREGINRISLLVFKKNESGNAFWESQEFLERPDLVYRNKTIIDG